MDLRGQRALVTGGAVRLGRAISEALADAGVTVTVHYRRSASAARALVKDLAARGVPAFAVAADLGGECECHALVDEAIRLSGGLDILVNNAAVFHKHPLADASEARLVAELRTNLMAPLALTRAFAARAGGGKVINLLDRRIASNEAGCLPYMLSKKALAEFTRQAAVELAPAISVNGVAPGAVLPPPGEGMNALRELAGTVPLGVQVQPRDIAEAVLFLLRSDAITGQILFVDGGQHLLGNGVR